MTEERRNAPELAEIEIDIPATEAMNIVCADCERPIRKGDLYVEFEESGPCCALCFLLMLKTGLEEGYDGMGDRSMWGINPKNEPGKAEIYENYEKDVRPMDEIEFITA